MICMNSFNDKKIKMSKIKNTEEDNDDQISGSQVCFKEHV